MNDISPVKVTGAKTLFETSVLVSLGTIAILAGSTSAKAEDWYRWRGPNLDGISKEKAWVATWPSTGPQQLWKAKVGVGFSSVAVSDGRVFTMGNQDNQDTVYCFEATTGKELWKHTYDSKLDAKYYEGGTSATPTVDGNRVYTLSKRGHLFCLEAHTGEVIWTKNLQTDLKVKIPTWGFAGSVLVQGDLLFLNVGTRGTALKKANGELVWTSGPDAAGYSTPVPFTMGGQPGLAFFGAKALYAVDPTSGDPLWYHPWKTSYDVNAADPIIVGQQVFISSGYNSGCALLQIDGDKPTEVWRNKAMRNQFNSCVLIDGYLYGFDEKGEFKCLDWKTGDVKWTEKNFSAKSQGALMAADGKLIALSDRGELAVVPADPTEFKTLSRTQVLGGKCWTTPVLSNGRIYCRNAAGDLVCLDVSSQTAATRQSGQ